MKRIFLLLTFALAMNSCDVPNEEDGYTFEIDPVFQVDMPVKYAVDSLTTIPVRYKRPSSCHFFNDFNYYAEGFNRTVAIEMLVSNADNCQTDNETVVEVPLKFRPIGEGTYHFKFWTGKNSAGVDQFLEYDAIVDH